ncbi:pyridoxal phosphate-dependent transferase [Radiomyces spectabilis]|uniref:pyridoxal phosphate-dependent transferase n=1 Tax=Radiomyces spectabilis TaxID=64574 RepID=UPI00221FFD13|nr:pyridoxal phosphate-dependent transferase [Radiomyces spectabilis]KAI8370418.1 pyridoxal phosphate-dependent transferase [Radiomyces spectabilis]
MSHPRFTPAARVAKFDQDVWSIFTPLAAETKAINLGQGFMNHPRGRPRLRNALAASYSSEFGRDLNPDTEILVTAGANEAMFATFAAYLDEGSEVICMEPFFDQYIANITMNGGKPVFVPLRPPAHAAERNISSAEWRLDIDELKSKITDKTKMIVLNTPHNPVGKVFSEEELLAIGKVAEDHNLIILSDEVYDRLYYPPLQKFPRIATLGNLWERTITVGSGGKSFAATGWRVGWLIGPEHLIKYSFAAQTRVVFCVNSPCQEAIAAGLEASLTKPIFADQTSAYLAKRSILSKVFDELNLPYTMPEGAYYILVNTAKIQLPKDYPFPALLDTRGNDFKMCYWLTKEIGVCAIPPSEFYTKDHWPLAENFARFAYCKTDDVLHQAVDRLRNLKPYITK